MPSFVVTAADREWFGRCHRAWDLSARGRRRLEPADGEPAQPTLARAMVAALAVHYFPGMWAWNRSIVDPLVVIGWSVSGLLPNPHQ